MTLADEISAARPEQQREMLERLWGRIHGKVPQWCEWYGDASISHDARYFLAMLDCGAYLSAAEMLVPEITTLEFHCDEEERWECLFVAFTLPFYGYGNSRPLALAAAIAKSLEGREDR